MKKITCILLMCAMLCGLAACGGDTSSDPNLGKWTAATAEMLGISMGVDTVFDGGFTVELKAKGKCTLVVSGAKGNGTWTLENGVFSMKSSGETYTGTLQNDVLTLEDVMGSGLTLVFTRDGKAPVASAATPTPPAADAGIPPVDDTPVNSSPAHEDLPEALQWWEGDWYGYWYVDMASGEYADWEGEFWDCYAVIDVDLEGAAMAIWNDEDAMGLLGLQIDPDGGVGYMGGATSEDGNFLGVDLHHADWIIRPGADGYDEHSIVIDAMLTDADNSDNYISYQLFLRPWGMLWDDIPEDSQPWDYADWYIGQGRYQEDMLEAMRDTALDDGTPMYIHPIVGGSTDNVSDNQSNNAVSGDSLIGEWVYEGGGYAYTFRDDGTGMYSYNDYPMEFTYTYTDTAVDLFYIESESPSNFTYRVEDGKLIVIDFFGSEVVYIKN